MRAPGRVPPQRGDDLHQIAREGEMADLSLRLVRIKGSQWNACSITWPESRRLQRTRRRNSSERWRRMVEFVSQISDLQALVTRCGSRAHHHRRGSWVG